MKGGIGLFNADFMKKLKYFGIFFGVYTIIFVCFFATISYTIPFVLALIIALWTKPIVRFLKNKWKMSSSLSSLISTILVFTIVFVILSLIVFKITAESKQLLANIPDINLTQNYIQGYLTKIEKFYNKIDPSLVSKVESQISSMISTILDYTSTLLNGVVSFAIGLPVLLMIIFITLLATYFFSKDMPNMEDSILSIFSDSARIKVLAVWNESVKMLAGYVKAYSLIVTVTFIETLLGFLILKVKYTLILAVLCWVLDLLPIVGIGVIYFPVAVIYIIQGNYFTGIGIIVLYAIVSVIRQVVEPKLVSSSLGLHPVSVLAALFIGLKIYGFTGILYLVFLMVFYNVLKKSDIL